MLNFKCQGYEVSACVLLYGICTSCYTNFRFLVFVNFIINKFYKSDGKSQAKKLTVNILYQVRHQTLFHSSVQVQSCGCSEGFMSYVGAEHTLVRII